jgi:hypothetical protein
MPGSRLREEGALGYVIAAYAIVIATLVGYGLRVQAERRALARRPPDRED